MFRKSIVALALALAFAMPAFAASPVNINTADAATIAASLYGIGLAKAQAIVDYRKAHGAFKSANDLSNVKGIGGKTLARNHDAIRLSGSFPAPTAPHARRARKH